jgi:cytochrome P450
VHDGCLIWRAQVPVAYMHRDPAVYSRPDEFLPERWLEGTPEHAADAYKPGAWLTFGEA